MTYFYLQPYMQVVTPSGFIQLLRHYSGSSDELATEVLSLKEEYPYSQVLHALSARLSQDRGFANHGKELQLAAVYAADRSVLKHIMTTTTDPWPVSHEVEGLTHEATPKTISTPQKPVDTSVTHDLAEEVLHDLEELSRLKHNFEMMFVEGVQVEATESTSTEVHESESEPETEEGKQKPRHLPPGRKPGRDKAKRIIELAKQIEAEQQQKDENASAEEGGELLNEISSSKKKIDPEGKKQREQIEMIDNFIRAQPSISSNKNKELPTIDTDLSGLQNDDFGDHVVSETLVALLIRQGKKERAVEVLKKLIWKFPQKKAYFAAQIEELKK